MLKLSLIHLLFPIHHTRSIGVSNMDQPFFMEEALKEAHKAFLLDEVPVGAIITYKGEIIARGHNQREEDRDPTAHAELLAIQRASQVLGGWRLTGCSLYVTLEPCSMCAGALILARIENLIFGTTDPKAGACGSVLDLVRHPALNHRLRVRGGVLEKESKELLKKFFSRLR